jgi:hypothetical protein
MPDQHPVYGSAQYRAFATPVVGAWAQRPALAWVRDTYRRQRLPAA